MHPAELGAMNAGGALWGWGLAEKCLGSTWPLLVRERARMLAMFTDPLRGARIVMVNK